MFRVLGRRGLGGKARQGDHQHHNVRRNIMASSSSQQLVATLRSQPAKLIRAFLGPSSQSLLPFIPRPIKLLIAFVFLLNWRSWPFLWHCKYANTPCGLLKETDALKSPSVHFRIQNSVRRVSESPYVTSETEMAGSGLVCGWGSL